MSLYKGLKLLSKLHLACRYGLTRVLLRELNGSGKICISSRLTQVGGQDEL